MRKDKINILILFLIMVIVTLFSYFLFTSGITSRLGANVDRLSGSLSNNINPSNYPIITMVVNSSGERLVNTDVTITVFAQSNYKIDKAYYSFDNKTWYDVDYFKKDNNITTKIIFKKAINKDVFIKVQNEKGYSSYAYKTHVNIDNEIPQIEVSNSKINAVDNYSLSSIQYSLDGINYDDYEVSGKKVSLDKNTYYNYVRAVDKAGNISLVKQVK